MFIVGPIALHFCVSSGDERGSRRSDDKDRAFGSIMKADTPRNYQPTMPAVAEERPSHVPASPTAPTVRVVVITTLCRRSIVLVAALLFLF